MSLKGLTDDFFLQKFCWKCFSHSYIYVRFSKELGSLIFSPSLLKTLNSEETCWNTYTSRSTFSHKSISEQLHLSFRLWSQQWLLQIWGTEKIFTWKPSLIIVNLFLCVWVFKHYVWEANQSEDCKNVSI